VELQEDIYSYTFFKFATSEDSVELKELFNKSIMSFIVQSCLIALVTMNLKFEWNVGSYQLNFTRVLTCFLLHLTIMPEIRCSLSIMRYSKQH